MCGVATCLLHSSPASAQYETPAGTRRPTSAPSKNPDDQSARDASILHRAHGDTPDGVPVGSFVLYPKLELDGEYDDNIFRTRNNRQGDFIFRVRPSFTLASDWSMHALELYALGELGRYADFGRESYEAYSLGTRVRIDINDDVQWLTDGDISRNRLSRGAPGLIGTPVGDNPIINTYTVGTQLVYNGDPFYGSIGPRYRRVDYVKGVPDTENFDVYEITGRVGYRVTPDFSVFLDPSYQWVRYDHNTDAGGFQRNNEGFDIRLGVAYDIAKTVTAELGAGYFRRTYSDPRFNADDGVSFLGRLYWNPTDTISVEAEGRRSFSQYRSVIGNATAVGNAIETYIGLRVGWEPIDPLVVDAGGAFAHYDYRGPDPNESYWFFDVGAKYYFTRNFYAGPRYFFEHRDSSPSILKYTDNRFLLTLGAQL